MFCIASSFRQDVIEHDVSVVVSSATGMNIIYVL